MREKIASPTIFKDVKAIQFIYSMTRLLQKVIFFFIKNHIQCHFESYMQMNKDMIARHPILEHKLPKRNDINCPLSGC